jgi:hypothetical protein
MPSFDGLNVLVDGLYRFEAQGSGISTYARTLGEGLDALGCNVSWLAGSAVAGGKADALSDEVALADRPPQLSGLRKRAQTLRRMGEGLTSANATARRLAPASAVLANAGSYPANNVFLAPDVYVKAHYRHMLLRQFTEIRAVGKIDVLHLTAPLPIRMAGVRTVTTIHDLVPIRLPWTTPDNKSEFIDRVRTSAKLSDLIITVSEASKRDIIVFPEKVALFTNLSPQGLDFLLCQLCSLAGNRTSKLGV